jgi:hypothetical protein
MIKSAAVAKIVPTAMPTVLSVCALPGSSLDPIGPAVDEVVDVGVAVGDVELVLVVTGSNGC